QLSHQVALSDGRAHVSREESKQRGGRLPARPVREARLAEALEVATKELARHPALRDGRKREVRIEPFEQTRATLRVRVTRPKAPDFSLAEQVVAREHLVRALAREHHLDARVPHEAGEHEQ